jgi:hypothetical protein
MPASTTILTDANTLAAGTPTANSTALAIAAAGPITDLQGMLKEAAVKAREYKLFLQQLQAVLDAADPLLTTVNNDLLSFV